MSKNIRNESTDGLFHAILSLQDMDECYTFFEDVCTIPMRSSHWHRDLKWPDS